jgi:hypothetical protein
MSGPDFKADAIAVMKRLKIMREELQAASGGH